MASKSSIIVAALSIMAGTQVNASSLESYISSETFKSLESSLEGFSGSDLEAVRKMIDSVEKSGGLRLERARALEISISGSKNPDKVGYSVDPAH